MDVEEHLGLATPLVRCGIDAGLLLLNLRSLVATGRPFTALEGERRLALLERLRHTRLPLLPELLRLFRYLGVLALCDESHEPVA